MLKGKHLHFRYGTRHRWILQDISLAIAPGEIVGLMAPSGFGKTTLAKVLAGYLTPNRGKVAIAGESLPLTGYCPVQLVFQNPDSAVNPRWRIHKILNEGYPPEASMLQALGVHPDWFDRYPHELSGGELQRIAVARVLNPATRYLIADEMTAMLDANTQALLWQAVLSYATQQSLGILVISHELSLMNRLCNRVVNLDEQPSLMTAPSNRLRDSI